MTTPNPTDPTSDVPGSGGAGDSAVEDHPILSVVARAGDALVGGLPASDDDLFADHFVFHYYNRQMPDLEGDYQGIEGLRTFFERLGAVGSGTFRIEPQSLTPFGDELVVAHVVNSLSTQGTALQFDALVVWRVVGGQVWEAWDIPAVNTAHRQSAIDRA